MIRFYPTGNAMRHQLSGLEPFGQPHLDRVRQLAKLWSDPVFWKVFQNTFVYSADRHAAQPRCRFLIAYHLDKLRFMHGFLRMLYFLPFMTRPCHGLGLALVLSAGPDRAFQQFPRQHWHPADRIPALDTNALPSILAPAVWAGLGFQVIIFMAGFARSREATTRPRASTACPWWTVLFEITIPLLKPTIVFIVVFSSIGFLRIFDHVFNMTTNDPGGPLNSTKPLVLMIYQSAFTDFDMGYAAAQTVVLFLILLGRQPVQLRILRDR